MKNEYFLVKNESDVKEIKTKKGLSGMLFSLLYANTNGLFKNKKVILAENEKKMYRTVHDSNTGEILYEGELVLHPQW